MSEFSSLKMTFLRCSQTNFFPKSSSGPDDDNDDDDDDDGDNNDDEAYRSKERPKRVKQKNIFRRKCSASLKRFVADLLHRHVTQIMHDLNATTPIVHAAQPDEQTTDVGSENDAEVSLAVNTSLCLRCFPKYN